MLPSTAYMGYISDLNDLMFWKNADKQPMSDDQYYATQAYLDADFNRRQKMKIDSMGNIFASLFLIPCELLIIAIKIFVNVPTIMLILCVNGRHAEVSF
jgi:hypothetical protein